MSRTAESPQPRELFGRELISNVCAMKIAVAGLGYVGLSNAALLARHHDVVALDIDEARVAQVNARVSPLEEADLATYLANEQLSLSATTDARTAFEGADVVFVATPTDYDPERNFFDTSSVEGVTHQVAQIAPQPPGGYPQQGFGRTGAAARKESGFSSVPQGASPISTERRPASTDRRATASQMPPADVAMAAPAAGNSLRSLRDRLMRNQS